MSHRKKIRNHAKKLAGRFKEGVGKRLKDDDLIVGGKIDQVSADVKQAGEKVKDAAKGVHKY